MPEIVEKCPICGLENRYILRRKSTHWKSGGAIYPRNRRALKIKLSGCSH